jgi:hypothetical protein
VASVPRGVIVGESGAINELARRGFTDGFRVVHEGLQVLRTGKILQAQDLVIRDVYRFEGVSDPDDMSVVYALESTSGVLGTFIDAFGVYADPAKTAALAEIPIRRQNAPTAVLDNVTPAA